MGNQKNCSTYSTFFKPLVFALLFVAIAGILIPCGYYEEDRTFSFFDPRVIRQPLFQHLFNIHSFPDHSGMPGKTLEQDEKLIMIREWKEYFKEIQFSENPENLLFKTDAKTLKAALPKYNTPDKKKFQDVYQYMIFVNDAKKYVEPQEEEWGGALEPPKNPKIMRPLMDTAAARSSDKSLNPFLRLRYGFQALRLAVFLEDYNKAINYYEQLVSPLKKGMIQYWAMGYCARAYFLSRKTVDALLIYLDIYDQYPAMLDKAILSIRRLTITEKNWSDAIARLTNNHKKATVWLMRSLLQNRDFSPQTLKLMSDLDPGSIRQEALLIRIIHTIEKYNFEADINYFFGKKGTQKQYEALITLCTTVPDEKKAKQPALWYTAGAYLSLLQGDTNKAGQLLTKAKNEPTGNPLLDDQIHLIETLLSIQKISSLTDTQSVDNLKTRLADDVKKLGGDTDPKSFNRLVTQSLLFLAADWFLVKGDPIRYAMATFAGEYKYLEEVYGDKQSQIDMLANDTQLDEFEKLISNPKKNPWDAWLINNYMYTNADDIIFLRGIKWIRQEQYDKAIEQLTRLKPDYWRKIDTSDLYKDGNIPGANLIDYETKTAYIRYNKIKISRDAIDFEDNPRWEIVTILDYCKIMKNLQEEAKRLDKKDGKAASNVYYTLGNIHFNLKPIGFPDIADFFKRRRNSQYSNFEYWHHPNIKNDIIDNFRKKKQDEYNKEMDNYLKAEKNFAKVVDIDADPELAAKCCLLVNMSRNLYLYDGFKDYKGDPYECPNLSRTYTISPDFKKHKNDLKYFYLLAQKYKDTEFFTNQVTLCPILEAFK